MTVATFTQPDYTTQLEAAYKAALDGAAMVQSRIGNAFAPHEQSSPNMTVRVDAGFIWDGTALTEVAAQSTGTITAPSGNPRIDRVVYDSSTGTVSVITGTEAASPSAPAITAGKVPICQVLLDNSPATTQIVNSLITDERVFGSGGGDWKTLGFMSASADTEVDFETDISTYDVIRVTGHMLLSANAALYGVLKANGTYQTGTLYNKHYIVTGSSVGQDAGISNRIIFNEAPGTAGRRCFFQMTMTNHKATGGDAEEDGAHCHTIGNLPTATSNAELKMGGTVAVHTDILNNAVDGFRLLPASGNITGEAVVEGRNLS